MPHALSPLAKELKDLEQQGHYVELISVLKAHMTHNKRTFSDPYVKEWVGKRWRNLFIQERYKTNTGESGDKKNRFWQR